MAARQGAAGLSLTIAFPCAGTYSLIQPRPMTLQTGDRRKMLDHNGPSSAIVGPARIPTRRCMARQARGRDRAARSARERAAWRLGAHHSSPIPASAAKELVEMATGADLSDAASAPSSNGRFRRHCAIPREKRARCCTNDPPRPRCWRHFRHAPQVGRDGPCRLRSPSVPYKARAGGRPSPGPAFFRCAKPARLQSERPENFRVTLTRAPLAIRPQIDRPDLPSSDAHRDGQTFRLGRFAAWGGSRSLAPIIKACCPR